MLIELDFMTKMIRVIVTLRENLILREFNGIMMVIKDLDSLANSLYQQFTFDSKDVCFFMNYGAIEHACNFKSLLEIFISLSEFNL